MPSVAVIILNFNGREHLERFLPSVIEYSTPHHIVVADNGSTDDSVAFLKENYPQLTLLTFKTNTGYCGGYNRAIREVKEDYVILLNSDIEVTQHWIAPVINMMEEDERIVGAQPKILSLKNPDSFEYAGAGGGYIDKLGFPFCRGRIFDSVEKDEGQYDDQREIFWATGACLFFRRKEFLQLGGLDEDYFAHMEEIDLCWRARNAGYTIKYQGKSTIYHLGGGTLAYKNPRKTYLNFRNNLRTLYKNLPKEMLMPVFMMRMGLDGLASIKFMFEGDLRSFHSVYRAWWNLLVNLGKWRKKRASIKQKNIYSEHIHSGSIVFDYYVRGKKKFQELKFH